MRNPLVKRLPSEFKNELGKYIVIFLFMALAVSLVSGWSVAAEVWQRLMMRALKSTI